ncbi:MAG TPA: type II pantothenate kinase [Ruminiclostridium sp.]
MSQVIGIDIGGSTTKIVGFDGKSMISPLLVRANDPIASVYGAFGKFLNINSFKLDDIERIMITGVGSSFINSKLFGIPTGRVDEFMAIGLGGLFLSNLSKAIIVSMGTGTALVKAENNTAVHLGGTGVGGGTLLGLSNRMLNVRHFDELIEAANGGDLSHVDLTIGDISKEVMETLPYETTASNFGKISDLATKADLAMGIINLVFQTIGMLAVFNTKIDNIKDVVLTGNLTNVPQSEHIFNQLSKLYEVNFQTPQNAEYATAVGAAICFTEGVAFREI